MKVKSSNQVALTLDVDWAPEWMIRELADHLVKKEIVATWFATGPSEQLSLLSRENVHEIALHPNFENLNVLTAKEILTELQTYFPNALGFRSHSLHQSSRILQTAYELGFKYDSNLLIETNDSLPSPFLSCQKILRFLHHYSDAARLNTRNLMEFALKPNQFNLFDFHPIHLWLGANTDYNYRQIKNFCSATGKKLEQVNRNEIECYREDSNWPLLSEFLNQTNNYEFIKLSDYEIELQL